MIKLRVGVEFNGKCTYEHRVKVISKVYDIIKTRVDVETHLKSS